MILHVCICVHPQFYSRIGFVSTHAARGYPVPSAERGTGASVAEVVLDPT